MRNTYLAVFALIALASPLAGQSIIGLTQTTPLVLSQDLSTCAPSQCFPAGFPATTVAGAGGTAYDHLTRGVWISNGDMIAKVDPRNQCVYQCPPIPMPNTNATNLVSGLAYNELTATLFVTDMSGVIRWYSVSAGCQLSLISRCVAPIPAGWSLTGVATNDESRLIFWCASTPGVAGGRVYVARQSAPCGWLCSFTVDQCGGNAMGQLTGLGYEACADRLWVTDGQNVVGGDFVTAPCGFNEVRCCVNSIDPYVGLCVMPATEQGAGFSCTDGACPSCPTMQHVLGSDPTFGNPAFSLDVVNAPALTNAWLVLNVGPCTAPGLGSPPFCAPVLVPLLTPWIVIGPMSTGGTIGCTGNATLPLGLPNSAAVCGLTLSTQWIGVCTNAVGFGTYVSNCLTWTIGGM